MEHIRRPREYPPRRLNPSVRRLRLVRCDAKKDCELRVFVHDVTGVLDLPNESFIVTYVMVRRKDCDGSVRAERFDCENTVQDSCRSTSIARLRKDLFVTQACDQRFVKSAVALLDHDKRALDRHQVRNSLNRSFEPGHPVHHRTELLWYVVFARDEASDGSQSNSFATGENDRRATRSTVEFKIRHRRASG